ncbi:uncharacterized protein COLE_01714 [Cutaneotrichosporon oleaginosum]|uniref:uncharacterized protein n=1 Tax=Cutaneotrichosporon oleaginosum TaxID=879819 RepID=UPI00132A5B63|nr:hypothetical protein COLE_01714 [Cutaneotrichosporon oleaginosum]
MVRAHHLCLLPHPPPPPRSYHSHQSTLSKRRLIRDFKRLTAEAPEGISGSPCPDNIMVWNAVIFGPADTPFEDGSFRLTLTFTDAYPNKPPTVRFVSRMFHPNIYNNGELCLDILQNRWSPTYDVAAILTSVQSLLNDPNPSSPANVEAATLFKDNKQEYERRVKITVEQSWVDDEDLQSQAEQSSRPTVSA